MEKQFGNWLDLSLISIGKPMQSSELFQDLDVTQYDSGRLNITVVTTVKFFIYKSFTKHHLQRFTRNYFALLRFSKQNRHLQRFTKKSFLGGAKVAPG